MSVKDRISAIPLTSLDAAMFMVMNYTVVDSDGLPESCNILILTNDSDRDVFISFDGVTDHEFLPIDVIRELNVQQNSQPQNQRCLWPKGTRIYVRSDGGAGSGALYVSGYFQPIQ